MHSSPRALPFVLLGVFTLLVVGGIALSLATAPPLAQQQLRAAAKTTMAAPSFVLTITDSVTNLQPASSTQSAQPSGTETLHVLYQAPDAVQETEQGQGGQSASVIVIGDRRFRATNGHWTELPSSPGLGTLAVATIMTPLHAAANATDVTRRGNLYRFGGAAAHGLVSNLLAVGAAPLSSPLLTAVVTGDYVTYQQVTAVVARQRLTLDLAFSSIGTAPPVKVPSNVEPQAPATPSTP